MTNKTFILNILGIAAFLAIVLFAIFTWLRIYTHHGKSITLPSYIDQSLASAQNDAQARTFDIIVNDSVHIVGKPGGVIQNQNPLGGSLVKENRKIYVTVTKFQADQVQLSDMIFFGEDYEQISRQLIGKSLNPVIKSYQFDALTKNSVMEVWYKGELIASRTKDPERFIVDKGETIEFVVSSEEGGVSDVPPLVGRTVEAAGFVLSGEGLLLSILYDNDLGIDDESQAIITSQDPPAGASLPRGGTITVRVKAQ